jgi:hypothetical protein
MIDDYRCPGLGEGNGDSGPDPGTGSGHDRDLPFKNGVHCYSFGDGRLIFE